MSYVEPPADPLRSVFTPDAMAILDAVQRPSEALTHRLEVLRASGPLPRELLDPCYIKARRAQKAAW